MAIYKDIENFPKLFDEEYKKTRELIEQGESHLDNLAEGFLEADRVLRKLPIADVVEVVRCKNCKHFRDDVPKPFCRFFGDSCGITLSHFCSYGERKE